jgi:spore germination cell wall hydrolase CwlJ-like protein
MASPEYQDWATDDRLLRLRCPHLRWPTRAFETFKPFRYALSVILAGYVATQIGYVQPPLPEPRTPVTVAAIPGPVIPTALEAQLEDDARLLADVAMGEDRNAAVAVMWVVLNRAQGRPILEAVTEGRAFGSMIRGRFVQSWSLDPHDRWRHPLSVAELHRLEGVAQAILLGYIPDPTGGAQFFHRKGTWTPPWAPDRDEWEQHGAHWFYQERSQS